MNLDKQQKQAVRSKSKNIIVAAGAGSGKTRVIVERIRWLIETGVKPNSIVAITFTNMAAQEMQTRLRDIPRTGDMFIGTIHSFANKLLRNSGKPYDIFNEQKQNDFMRFLCRKYGKHLTFDRYLQYMEYKKNIDLGTASEGDVKELFSAGEWFELKMFLDHRKIKSNEKEYPSNIWKLCAAQHIITFDELLKLAGEYFSSIEGQGIQHLLVDELQDVGHLEYEFLRALNAANNFYVGDDWQAIYGFKGGNVKIFKSLIKNPEWERVDLVNNYRCGQNIVITATDIIGQCDDIVFKEVCTVSNKEGSVETGSKFQLEKYLEDIVAAALDNGDRLKNWFLLVRSNKDLVEVTQRLEAMQVPFDSFRKSDITYGQLQDIMESDTIKLLTIHMAKGLEAKNVLLWGNFPLDPPSYMVNKEERRVLYVGVTRAEERLIVLT